MIILYSIIGICVVFMLLVLAIGKIFYGLKEDDEHACDDDYVFRVMDKD